MDDVRRGSSELGWKHAYMPAYRTDPILRFVDNVDRYH